MLLVLSEHGHYNGLNRSDYCNFCMHYKSIKRAFGFAVLRLGVAQERDMNVLGPLISSVSWC